MAADRKLPEEISHRRIALTEKRGKLTESTRCNATNAAEGQSSLDSLSLAAEAELT